MSSAPHYRHHKGRSAVVCLSIAILLSVSVAVGLFLRAARMAPVRPGESAMFWKLACDVDLAADLHATWGGGAYFVDETWAAYEWQHIHGSTIYRLPVPEVLADFDAVIDALQRASEHGGDSPFVTGYVKWRDESQDRRTAQSLLETIGRERKRKMFERDIDLLAWSVAKEQQFWERWQRSDWYGAAILFEWVFLSGWVLFALWPGIRRQRAYRWGLHAVGLPLLFLLPAYLGYATYSFTSAGPTGGIVYPFLLWWCPRGWMTALDQWMLSRLPQVLEPLSTPVGSWIALTGMGMPGPTFAVAVGLVAAGFVLATSTAYVRWISPRHRRAV